MPEFRRTVWGTVATVVMLAMSACTADRATRPEEVRGLAGGVQAEEARQRTEARLRATVREYTDHTSLALGLLVLRDTCAGGKAKQWLGSNGDDTYKVTCSMQVTAYFGADPKRIASVLDDILTTGERSGSTIPFTHRSNGVIVDYYRNRGGDNGTEPSRMDDPWHSLSWDTQFHDRPPAQVREPQPCFADNPPVMRCVREPGTATVADLRKRHGMVFELSLVAPEYFKVPKS
ncbi:hypothetical protein [Streptomyces sp. SID4985]|uniref:hypothetical protein n=1 Tax=unclassified Streptomyces TaxID=2593676 RepID=UPI00136EEE5B|nr:hypothetical protein [Streptomyces sp. SID4985]MYQ47839.1 hypothetical protein [Streptomyces sp. SID4985]